MKASSLLFAAGWIVYAVTEIWAFVLCLGVIAAASGFWGTAAAVVGAPVYAGLAFGSWFPLLLKVGGSVALPVLLYMSSALASE